MAVESTMMPMTLSYNCRDVGGGLVIPEGVAATPQTVATSAVTDSREVGEAGVFVAIAGERVDGHDFVGRAAQSGAAVALVAHQVDAPMAQIVVPDTVAALGTLAQHNIERRRALGTPFTIIGITGSVGKTTTKDMLAALLGSIGETVAPVGSFNNEIGLPLTALKVGPDTRYLVAEMGANHVGEIARLTTIAPPDIAVVLKVGVAHLGEFGSVERIVQAKSEIVRGLADGGVADLNADDERVASMSAQAPGEVLWFGVQDERALASGCSARDIGTDALDRPRFTLSTPDGAATAVRLGICGRHNVERVGGGQRGIPTGHAAGPHRRGAGGPDAHQPPSHGGVDRRARRRNFFTLIDDSFNANPDSMRAGLEYGLMAWGAGEQTAPYRVAVLGAMLELGANDLELHRGVGEYAARCGVDAVVAVGGTADAHLDALAEAVAQGAKRAQTGATPAHPSIDWVHDADQADAAVVRLAREHGNAVVLLKGSHVSGLSALAERWTA